MSEKIEIARSNVRNFIAFRIFFNARFYYPVFAVIYLDFGMTLEQFAILNSIWAASIILAEVPSGALSDMIGRKKMIVAAGIFMVIEMVVWGFAPTSDLDLLFWILAINRILSGLAEAAASGADEALVYDSIDEAGKKEDWAKILQKVTRWQSFAFMIALLTGGIIYDPDVMNQACAFLGFENSLTQQDTMRWPILLNLVTAVLTLLSACALRETENYQSKSDLLPLRAAFSQTWNVALWIARTPFALLVILAAATVDSVIRMFITMNSEYYRLISYPEVAFGIIGAVIALQGMVVARISREMTERFGPNQNFLIISVLALLSFIGIRFFIPHFGVIFSMLLFAAMGMTGFCTSYYLNKTADKSIRATLLSFKGLALNLGYGGIGILYALLVVSLRKDSNLANDSGLLFQAAADWFAPWFAITFIGMLLCNWKLRPKPPA
ncbi:MFS transporter [Opitutales bacterium]|jgi:MFS family permease|nr:MFS transporter [Opitutales bacterium]MDA9119890.1 MFS transporter [Opitutales bacterium]MDC0363709.1 MFS transporter [Opitutales bacterium]MDC0646459.1 MFS transporter [Opitutales bacterium]